MIRFTRPLIFVTLSAFVILGRAHSQAPEDASLVRMKKDIFYLASPECEGRGTRTKGINLAADYIAKQFADAGLKPGGTNDTYFQPFKISGSPTLGSPNSLAFKGPLGQTIDFVQDKDFRVMGLSGKGKVDAPLVFAGYGLQSKQHNYDDYAGLDVAGKIVIVLRHTPRWNNTDAPFGGKDRDSLASLERKVALAESNKAKAVIVVNDLSELVAVDPHTGVPGVNPKAVVEGDVIPKFSYLVQATSSRIPCLHVKRSVLEPVFQNCFGKSLGDLEKAIDADLKPRSAALPSWAAKVETTLARDTVPVKNIIGVLEGSGPLAKEIIVVGAHYDHLGYGGVGSLAKNPKEPTIHFGADDNASGTTAMVELARRFAGMKNRQGRKLVFMAFSAEELGLLGSRHYCATEPLFPLADTAAMVNLDMVGKLRPDPTTKKDKLIVQGTGTAKGFDQLVDKLNTVDFTFAKVPAGMGPSDHASFYQAKVPVLFFWTGVHPDYHKPTDTPDRIDLVGMKKIADYVQTVIAQLSSETERPVFQETKSSGTPIGAPKGPRLGIIPNYESDKEGVTLGGVSDEGAAAKAGLKAGDRIVELAGKNVSTIETYMVIMSQLRVGQTVDVGLIRDGKKVTLKITPQ